MGVNYGFEKSASWRRSAWPARPAAVVLERFEEKRPSSSSTVTVEIEGEDKPALIAEWIGMIFV